MVAYTDISPTVARWPNEVLPPSSASVSNSSMARGHPPAVGPAVGAGVVRARLDLEIVDATTYRTLRAIRLAADPSRR